MERSNHELIHCDAYDLIESLSCKTALSTCKTASSQQAYAAIDIVLLAPPWGGVDYKKKRRGYAKGEGRLLNDATEGTKGEEDEEDRTEVNREEEEEEEEEDGAGQATFDLRLHISSGDGIDLLQKVSVLSANIVYLLPRNTNLRQIEEMRDLIQRPCRVEKILLRKKLKMIVVYFGEMFRGEKETLWLPSLSK